MQKENTIKIELTIDELNLIRHATWSIEKEIKKSVKEHKENFQGNEYLDERNAIDKEMYFDAGDLREKIIHEVHESELFYKSKKENELKGFDMSRYCGLTHK